MTTTRRPANALMIVLALLNSIGTTAAGVAVSLMAPTPLGLALVALCCVGTVIGWQLCD